MLVPTSCAAEDALLDSMRERCARDCALRACFGMGYMIVQCIDSKCIRAQYRRSMCSIERTSMMQSLHAANVAIKQQQQQQQQQQQPKQLLEKGARMESTAPAKGEFVLSTV